MIEIPLTYACLENSPLGMISVGVSDQGLAQLAFSAPPPGFASSAAAAATLEQVDAYLRGLRRNFDLTIDWRALPAFQRAVLQITWAIPYGTIRTYQSIADELGKPGAARAVGQAEARNPMPIVIPCHRVVGSDGQMHGYGGRGGIPTKVKLLKMEGHSFPEEQLSLF